MQVEEQISEIDPWELDAELYRVWKLLEKRNNYGKAENKVAALWTRVHRFNIDETDQPSSSMATVKPEEGDFSDPEWWICGGGPGVPFKFGYGYWTGPDHDLLCVVPEVRFNNEAERLLSPISRVPAIALAGFWLKRLSVLYLFGGRLKGSGDTYLLARLTKALYRLLNLIPRRCHKLGYWCEHVYPYGWVPEAGCPIHD
jgi:hypothetical protein